MINHGQGSLYLDPTDIKIKKVHVVLEITRPFVTRFCMFFFAYTRPRYQVSVYRPIGPLVFH